MKIERSKPNILFIISKDKNKNIYNNLVLVKADTYIILAFDISKVMSRIESSWNTLTQIYNYKQNEIFFNKWYVNLSTKKYIEQI